jgi:hypothetical protein
MRCCLVREVAGVPSGSFSLSNLFSMALWATAATAAETDGNPSFFVVDVAVDVSRELDLDEEGVEDCEPPTTFPWISALSKTFTLPSAFSDSSWSLS